MEGKRISTPDAGTEAKKKLPIAGIIAAILAALLLGTMTGLCLYAGSYEKIFPGVYVGSVDLGGQDRETAQRTLSARMSELTDPYTITITADGRDLGEYTPSQLGGYTDAQELADQAYAVGRGTGPVSFVTSGIAMARGLLGISTELSPAILYDEDDLEDAVADIAAEFDLEPLDGSYELTRDGLFATKHQDGRALDREALAAARSRGSENNDPIVDAEGHTRTNHAGGINGGITNGNEVVVRAALKPTPSISRPQETYNLTTGRVEALEIRGRHDACVALRGAVVVEAAVAIALADLMKR